MSTATFDEVKKVPELGVELEFPGSAEARAALGLSFKQDNVTDSRCLVVCLLHTTHAIKLSLGFGSFPGIVLFRSRMILGGDSSCFQLDAEASHSIMWLQTDQVSGHEQANVSFYRKGVIPTPHGKAILHHHVGRL